MHFSTLALLSLPILAAAADLELDNDDIPQACRSICGPIKQLVDQCDVDDDQVRDDRVEDLLNLQCVCTNSSFNAGRFAGLCQSCMSQNNAPRDGTEDINEIVSRCGFAAQTYAASQSTEAAAVTVQATRPTAASQLTTTFSPGAATGTATGSATGTTTGAGGATAATSSGAAPAATTTQAGGAAAARVGGGAVAGLAALLLL